MFEPNALLPKLKADLAGGRPAGVVVEIVFPKPAGGAFSGVVLIGSANADPFTGVDGAIFVLPNIDPLGVLTGVVVPNADADAFEGVFGKVKADFALGVVVTPWGADDGPPTPPKAVDKLLLVPNINGGVGTPLLGGG